MGLGSAEQHPDGEVQHPDGDGDLDEIGPEVRAGGEPAHDSRFEIPPPPRMSATTAGTMNHVATGSHVIAAYRAQPVR